MTENIRYKKELFEFVNDLTAINPSIAFERKMDNVRNEERIIVSKSDKNKTLPYILSVPVDYFDIDNTVAFYDYNNFYRFFSTIKDVKMSIKDDQKMVMKGKNVSINYLLSDSEGIINGPKERKVGDGDIRFTLPKEILDEIVKINSLVKGHKARITVEGDNIGIHVYSSGGDNTFNEEFVGERVSDYEDDFAFTILSNRFDLLPSKRDYTVDLFHKKFVKFSLINEDIDFELYSGDIS